MITTKLQYISQGGSAETQESSIRQALDHGADWIQLRWKNADDRALRKLAEKIKIQCQKYGATYIINDHVALVKVVDADGVHLGLEDAQIAVARETLGAEKIIGGTANTIEEILRRIKEGCDYIGVGPYRTTDSKEKLRPILGLGGYRKIVQYLQEQQISFPPIYAIGGIVLSDIPFLLQEGIYGVAVSRAITDAPDTIIDFKQTLLCIH